MMEKENAKGTETEKDRDTSCNSVNHSVKKNTINIQQNSLNTLTFILQIAAIVESRDTDFISRGHI